MSWKLIPDIVRSITGKTNYLTVPRISLENAADKRGDTFTGHVIQDLTGLLDKGYEIKGTPRPRITLWNAAGSPNDGAGRFYTRHSSWYTTGIMANLQWNGEWNLDDTTKPGWNSEFDWAQDWFQITRVPAGANPRTSSNYLLFRLQGDGTLIVGSTSQIGGSKKLTLGVGDVQESFRLWSNVQNAMGLIFRTRRTAASPDDWTTAAYDIVKRVDVTDQQTINFQPNGDIVFNPYTTGGNPTAATVLNGFGRVIRTFTSVSGNGEAKILALQAGPSYGDYTYAKAAIVAATDRPDGGQSILFSGFRDWAGATPKKVFSVDTNGFVVADSRVQATRFYSIDSGNMLPNAGSASYVLKQSMLGGLSRLVLLSVYATSTGNIARAVFVVTTGENSGAAVSSALASGSYGSGSISVSANAGATAYTTDDATAGITISISGFSADLKVRYVITEIGGL